MGCFGLFEIASGQWNEAHALVVVYPPRQGADVVIFEDPHRAECDFHFLFAVLRQRGAILAGYSRVDDPKPDFRPRGARSVSRTGCSLVSPLVTF